MKAMATCVCVLALMRIKALSQLAITALVWLVSKSSIIWGRLQKSGTKEFLTALGQDQAKNSQLIGQFGGFYSAFIVADKVTVKPERLAKRRIKPCFGNLLGEGEYSVADIEKKISWYRCDFTFTWRWKRILNEWRLREIIGKYSDHIGLPVEMLDERIRWWGQRVRRKWEKNQ